MSVVNKLLENIADKVVLSGEMLRAEFSTGLAQTRNALRITGARNAPIYPNTVLNAGPARVVGWSVRETSGSNPVQVTLYDARDTSGDVLAVLNLPAGATSNHGLPSPGVTATEAVYVAVTGTGAVQGSVYVGAVD